MLKKSVHFIICLYELNGSCITDTQNVASFNLPKSKIRVIYEAGKEIVLNKSTPTFFENEVVKNIQKKGYILHVGTFDKRKNIPKLIEAFAQLIQDGNYPDLKLLLVGQASNKVNSNDTEEINQCIQKHQLENLVLQTGYVTDIELAYCYQNALIYIFPSINEGFGLPLLEAFQYEVPVLIANNTCLPEVAGNAALSFNPYEVNDMANKMKELLDSPSLQKEMIALGQERLTYFSWQKTSSLLLSVFKEAVKEKA